MSDLQANSRNEGTRDVQERYCSHHCRVAPVDGGQWRTVDHGRGRKLGRRWVCGACIARIRAARLERMPCPAN